MILNMFSYFKVQDERVHTLADFLIAHELEDGGWNCNDWRGSTHSSFHTTCSVLEALLQYERSYSKNKPKVKAAQEAGQEFFLQHRLYKSHSRGTVVKQKMLLFPYLPQWQYDFLKGLDYFVDAGAKRDKRAADALELLEKVQDKDGLWPQHRTQAGKYYFQFETPGKPGRGNTLRALRVLRWWYGK